MKINIGPIFALLRKSNGKTLNDIYDQSLPTTKINDFENEKRELPENQVRELYQRIGLEYVKDETIVDVINEGLRNIIHDISFGNGKEISVLDELANKLVYIKSSPAFITWLLCNFVIHVYHSKDSYQLDKDITVLNNYIEYLDDHAKQILYDTLGVYYKNHSNYDQAMYYFDQAIHHSVSESVLALAYYHKTMLLNGNGELIEALESIKKAKKLFDMELNHRRSILVSISQSVNYNLQGYYDKTEQICFQILESMELIPFTNKIVVYNNLIWNYLLWEKYDKVLEYSKIALEIDHTYADIYLYQVLAYRKLNQLNKAKEMLKEAREYMENASKYNKALIKAMASIISSRPYEQQEKRLLEAYDVAISIHDHQLQIYTLDLLSEICNMENCLEKENYYLKLAIKKLKERR